MVNCYICGQRRDLDEVIDCGKEGGVTVETPHGKVDLFDGQYICNEDNDADCEREVEGQRDFYPEELGEEPNFVEPWWKNP